MPSKITNNKLVQLKTLQTLFATSSAS